MSRQVQLRKNAELLLNETKQDLADKIDEQSQIELVTENLESELKANTERNKYLREEIKKNKEKVKMLKDKIKPLLKEEKFLIDTIERLKKNV